MLAEKRVVEHKSVDATTSQLARQALRQDPTVVQAVEVLGMQAQMANDVAMARRLFAYAQTLTRREVRTQLWAIEDAAARNDVPSVLRHYDIVLRTSKSASELLYPALTKALAAPEVRTRLVNIFADKPLWAPGFIAYAAASTENPSAVAEFTSHLARAGYSVSATAQTAIVNNLIMSGKVEAGWNYYALLRPGADRRRSRDPDFTANLETPSVLDWVSINDGGITTTIRDGAFEFGAPPSVGGVLLKQMQLLPAGTYRLEGQSLEIEQASGALPFWTLVCRDGRELGRVAVSNSAEGRGAFAGRFIVPPDCPVQTLTLVARPSDEIGGISGLISRARLAPAT